jgi:ribosome-associated toxin RatA of RatAB toxin-antitoxin module
MDHRALLLALLVVAVPAAPANSVSLSSDQRLRLDRGEVVLVDVLPRGGREPADQGGTALARIQASPDAVWQVLTDYPGHRGLYPRIVSVDVLEADPRRALLRYTLGIGPFSFGFHVSTVLDPARWRISWQLDHGRANNLFRDTWGYWEIEPSGAGVVLTYAMAARTILPAFVTRGIEREGLVETVKAVRERAEREQASGS